MMKVAENYQQETVRGSQKAMVYKQYDKNQLFKLLLILLTVRGNYHRILKPFLMFILTAVKECF